MRKIKFRAKSLHDNSWRYGYVTECDEWVLIDQRNEAYQEYEYNFRGDSHFYRIAVCECNKETVGQFTGMYDMHNKEIYEGDIVLQKGYNNKKIAMEVKFEHGAFIVGYHQGSSTKSTPMLLNDRCEVIGNIYDNPELLKGE